MELLSYFCYYSFVTYMHLLDASNRNLRFSQKKGICLFEEVSGLRALLERNTQIVVVKLSLLSWSCMYIHLSWIMDMVWWLQKIEENPRYIRGSDIVMMLRSLPEEHMDLISPPCVLVKWMPLLSRFIRVGLLVIAIHVIIFHWFVPF